MNKAFTFLLLWVGFASIGQTFNQLDEKGLKHGIWKGVYEESKRPRYEGKFDHGKETGTFSYFDDTKSGSLIATREFQADGSAYTIFYDQKKNKVSEGRVVNKKYEGEWKYYHYQSPALMTRENYKDGKLHGPRKVYYNNGKIAEEEMYQNGVKHGPYKKYTDTGIVLEEVEIVNGQMHGESVNRNPDGTLASKGKYVEGAKKGYWEFYSKGKLSKKEKYPVVKKFKKLPPRENKQ